MGPMGVQAIVSLLGLTVNMIPPCEMTVLENPQSLDLMPHINILRHFNLTPNMTHNFPSSCARKNINQDDKFIIKDVQTEFHTVPPVSAPTTTPTTPQDKRRRGAERPARDRRSQEDRRSTSTIWRSKAVDNDLFHSAAAKTCPAEPVDIVHTITAGTSTTAGFNQSWDMCPPHRQRR